MPTAIIPHHRLLALLLAHWGTSRGRVSPYLHLRLQRLWRLLPDDGRIEDLKRYLCPVFAADANQQQAFNELFDRLLVDLIESEQSAAHTSDVPADTSKEVQISCWIRPSSPFRGKSRK